MNGLLWTLLLALAWTAMTGSFTAENFLLGAALGLLTIILARRVLFVPVFLTRLWNAGGLVLFFVWELLVANLRLAWDVITPRHRMRPGILAVPLDARSDGQLLLLTSLISLTPGTLTIDVAPDRSCLYVHAMYIDDVERTRQGIKTGYERRVIEVLS